MPCCKRLFFLILIFCFNSTLNASQQLIIEPEMGRAPLLKAINEAKSSIDLVMYGFTDMQFADALIEAKKNNINVRVLLQHFPYKSAEQNQAVINHLQKAKVSLVWPDKDYKLTHQKTFLLDQNKAIIMTFNLTHSTFKKTRNFALVVSDADLVQEIQQVFNNDWQHKASNVTQPNLLWSPNNSREKLLTFIRSAKTEIKMYAEGLNDYQVIGALAKAAQAGVHVQVITSKDTNPQPSKKLDFLSRSGVIIGYDKDYFIHAKMILIDNAQAILGSINFTRASINDNRELSIITQDKKVIAELNQTFNSDWEHCYSNQTVAPTKTIKTTDYVYMLIKNLRQIARLTKTQHQKSTQPHKKKKTYSY
jgi:cardiolipin synthase A/B